MKKESFFLANPYNCNMLSKTSGCLKKGDCEHKNRCKKIFLKYQQVHWNDLAEFSPAQVELIKKYCDYEWDGDVEKEIQRRLDYWIVSYDIDEIPFTLKHDFWRDLLTSIFDVHNEYILKTIEEKRDLG